MSADTLNRLAGVLEQRKQGDPDSSYVAGLYAKGLDAILKKIGEEATEVVLAGRGQSEDRLAEESADLLYHLLVMLRASGVPLADVVRTLQKRHA